MSCVIACIPCVDHGVEGSVGVKIFSLCERKSRDKCRHTLANLLVTLDSLSPAPPAMELCVSANTSVAPTPRHPNRRKAGHSSINTGHTSPGSAGCQAAQERVSPPKNHFSASPLA